MLVEPRVWRVLDANANRAAEALRVLEDTARLVQEDSLRAGWLKELRHALAQAVSALDRENMLASRSTQRDAGASRSVDSELARSRVGEIVRAEVTRVGEALRVLEEYSKLVDGRTSGLFKQLRYRAYDRLAKIELAWSGAGWPEQLRVCLLIDCVLPLDRFVAYVERLAGAGLRCLQIRDKQRDDRDQLPYIRAAVELLHRYQGKVIVNDRVDLALAGGADGVHVGQEDLSVNDVRRIAGERLWIGVSTHDIHQARQAQQEGADYIGCGPTFPSRTKAFEQFAGPEFLREVAREIQVPALAIGGIQLDNISQVVQCGIRRVAVSAAVHQASDPAAAVALLLAALAPS